MECNRNNYYKSLVPSVQKRYMDKLILVNNVDPYSVDINTCSNNLQDFPKVDYFDIVNYLVHQKSAYTQEEFRAHKSLEAYNLFTCNWVQNLYVKTVSNSTNVILLSRVKHSQRLNLPPTNTWCITKATGQVLAAHCDCIAGLGECCSHVGATLFAVEASVRNIEEVSVTDKKAYWMVPTCILGEPSRISEVNYSVHNDNSDNEPISDDDSVKVTEDETKIFLNKLNTSHKKAAILNVMPPYCYSIAEERKTVQEQKKTGDLSSIYSAVNEEKTLEQLRELGKEINITLSENDCVKISIDTKEQNKNDVWFIYRQGRITASKFKNCCRTNINKPAISIIKAVCYKTTFRSKQTDYGCHHEKDAVKAYTEYMAARHINFVIEDCGLIINPECPYFGASPDAMVRCDCCGLGCLEVKCPYCIKNASVEELLNLKSTCLKAVPISDKFNNIELDKNHSYYYQIQMQMAVTGRSFCDFVVWCEENFYFERLYPNKEFYDAESNKAKLFFYEVIMPELLGKYFTKREQRVLDLKRSQREAIAENPEKLWCKCQRPDDGNIMVWCSNENCSIGWYHLHCLKRKRIPKGDWYCPKCKKEFKKI